MSNWRTCGTDPTRGKDEEEEEEEEEEEGKREGEEGAAPCVKGAASADSIKCPISPCVRPRVDNTCALSSLLTVWVTCLDGSVNFSCSGGPDSTLTSFAPLGLAKRAFLAFSRAEFNPTSVMVPFSTTCRWILSRAAILRLTRKVFFTQAESKGPLEACGDDAEEEEEEEEEEEDEEEEEEEEKKEEEEEDEEEEEEEERGGSC